MQAAMLTQQYLPDTIPTELFLLRQIGLPGTSAPLRVETGVALCLGTLRGPLDKKSWLSW
jgi:hypothetical protein